MQFYRTTCSFDAHGGRTHVEGRLHVELADSPEDATAKSIAYLESCHYTNVKVHECHLESDAEKYTKARAIWNAPEGLKGAADRVAAKAEQKPEPQPQAPAGEYSDDLF